MSLLKNSLTDAERDTLTALKGSKDAEGFKAFVVSLNGDNNKDAAVYKQVMGSGWHRLPQEVRPALIASYLGLPSRM